MSIFLLFLLHFFVFPNAIKESFAIFDVILFRAVTSASSCRPEKEGKYFGIWFIDACARWEQEKASFT